MGAIPDDALADDRRSYAGHVYRTLTRLARRDPALQVALGNDGQIEVRESGARITWYLPDVRGEPYRYGVHDDEAGSVFALCVPGMRRRAWCCRQRARACAHRHH